MLIHAGPNLAQTGVNLEWGGFHSASAGLNVGAGLTHSVGRRGYSLGGAAAFAHC